MMRTPTQKKIMEKGNLHVKDDFCKVCQLGSWLKASKKDKKVVNITYSQTYFVKHHVSSKWSWTRLWKTCFWVSGPDRSCGSGWPDSFWINSLALWNSNLVNSNLYILAGAGGNVLVQMGQKYLLSFSFCFKWRRIQAEMIFFSVQHLKRRPTLSSQIQTPWKDSILNSI